MRLEEVLTLQQELASSQGKLIIDFPRQMFDFQNIFNSHISSLFPQCSDPGDLHLHIPADLMPSDIVKGTHHTYGHELLYAIDKCFRQDRDIPVSKVGFYEMYIKFVTWIKDTIVKEPIYFQSRPTLRIHYPNFTSNQAGLGIMHTDRDWNHPPEEINFWLPLFHCKNSSTLLLEDDYKSGSFNEMSLDFGRLLIFDSSLYHGNQVSKEQKTRISMDFRIIPECNYQDNGGQFSRTAGLEFTKGGYYQFMK